jgi:hypothetical protein
MSDDPNIDEAIEQMERDELSDAPLLSPRDMAKVLGIAPQLLYYYIRTGKIEPVICNCGRKCVDVETTKAFFESKGKHGA